MSPHVLLSRSRRFGARTAVAAVAVSGLVLGVAPPVHADSGDQLVCTAGGAITIVHNASTGLWDWVMTGVGACTVPDKPAQFRELNLVGTAATHDLGVCSNSPFIDAFNMSVTATFASVAATGGLSQTVEHESWALPETSFPIVSPFAVNDAAGNPIGAGEFETHVFVHCPPDGQPTMQANWVQSA